MLQMVTTVISTMSCAGIAQQFTSKERKRYSFPIKFSFRGMYA